MNKNTCCFVCRGCLPMLAETAFFISAFLAAVLAVIYPLISG